MLSLACHGFDASASIHFKGSVAFRLWSRPRICIRAVHSAPLDDRFSPPRHRWLKEVDQAPQPSSIRRQKDRYLREIALSQGEIRGLFSDDEKARKSIEPSSAEELAQRETSEQRREDVTEAMRVYRLLRPDARPFYEEDSKLSMQAKMNRLMAEDENALEPQKSKFADPFAAYLPVVNQRAFLIALESVTASLADDIETICQLLGIAVQEFPSEDDPLRFKKLVDLLFSAFPLKKDPSKVEEFMDTYWTSLKSILPQPIADMEKEQVADWLRAHLYRVRLNQRRNEPKIFLHKSQSLRDDEYYSFSEDFPYDDDPMPGLVADERNLDFPLENASEYMHAFLSFLSDSSHAKNYFAEDSAAMTDENESSLDTVANQFQDFVWDLEKVGLRNWLKMDIRELERFLPKGELQPLPVENVDDCEVAWLMLRCAARDRANLLDFEKLDPYKMLHGLPAREIDEELAALPPHPHLDDKQLGELVDAYVAKGRSREKTIPTDSAWLGKGAAVDEIFKRELDFYRTAGPVEWIKTKNNDGFTWKWRQPPNTFWDERRKVFIPQQRGVDPSLDLKEMRQHLLEMARMGSMTKDGRLYYYRAIVVVGNGKGVYGFGIGFANTPKEARTDAALKALQNINYIDMDSGRMMCFPVRGTEYKVDVRIIPRPIGRGLKSNKRWLPLLYILGLDNCKVRFMNANKQFTRVRAIQRTLEQIVSRRTLANMTGKRHSLLIAPGDHWVHWPDRWFAKVRESYDAKSAYEKLKRRHILCHKKRGNKVVQPGELKPGWRHENWVRWNNPLERWLQHRRSTQPTTWDPAKSAGSDNGAVPAPNVSTSGPTEIDTGLKNELMAGGE